MEIPEHAYRLTTIQGYFCVGQSKQMETKEALHIGMKCVNRDAGLQLAGCWPLKKTCN